MKVLLDESVPQKLRSFIDPQHTVVTTGFQGWSGLQNGDLLATAEQAGFELLITADQGIRYQQNLSARNIAVIILSSNNWSTIKLRSVAINSAISGSRPGSFSFVDLSG